MHFFRGSEISPLCLARLQLVVQVSETRNHKMQLDISLFKKNYYTNSDTSVYLVEWKFSYQYYILNVTPIKV